MRPVLLTLLLLFSCNSAKAAEIFNINPETTVVFEFDGLGTPFMTQVGFFRLNTATGFDDPISSGERVVFAFGSEKNTADIGVFHLFNLDLQAGQPLGGAGGSIFRSILNNNILDTLSVPQLDKFYLNIGIQNGSFDVDLDTLSFAITRDGACCISTDNVLGELVGTGGPLPEFIAPIPEPATWLMMVFGFGGIGVALKRRRRIITDI